MRHVLAFVRSHLGGRHVDAIGHRIVHGGTDFTAPVRLDADTWLGWSGSYRWRRCTSRTTSRRSGPCWRRRRRSSRSAASTPPFTRRSPRWPRPSRCLRKSRSAACGATASTACPTNTSPPRCRRWMRAWRRARSSSRISATAPACARSMPAQRRQHHGLHRRRRLPMGTRSGTLDPGVILYLLDEMKMGPREIERPALPEIRPARRVRPVERHAHAGSQHGAARPAGHRSLHLPDRPGKSARWPQPLAAWTGSSSRPVSASTARRSAGPSAVQRHGSAWRSTRRRTNPAGPDQHAGQPGHRLGRADR